MENQAKSFNLKTLFTIILVLLVAFTAYYFVANGGNLFQGKLTKNLGMDESDCSRTFSTYFENANNVSSEEVQFCYEQYPDLWKSMKPEEMMDPVFDTKEKEFESSEFSPAPTQPGVGPEPAEPPQQPPQPGQPTE